ncbi:MULTISPECIES: DUF6474 family protein [Actinokineospora]|uniref:Uncharacterized protein n=1 Tax=Actinokineospora fastidiosa TaxID=1816 RepID=A0A918G546_9PSEU|nr:MULTISPECIES: DUF6474 family protein [Actinokineospora]UVS76374.1 hypothetical protein Actkin_00058 [Actinokineospora sp. UTMC 2448]GGS18686.1 hypothetical protein GCM10010171_09030 [Actinokineospora fastidiosa]
MARITPSRARNAIAVAKVIAPALIPVVTPYLIKATGTARERWDRHRARRLGVAVGDLAQYSGHGGALHARISGVATALAEQQSPDRETETRLRQLAAAVRAAERMPASRRRAAHRAVDSELDAIEERLLQRLGVRQPGRTRGLDRAN